MLCRAKKHMNKESTHQEESGGSVGSIKQWYTEMESYTGVVQERAEDIVKEGYTHKQWKQKLRKSRLQQF